MSAFSRFNSSTPERPERKVKGPVIGIDLGMFASAIPPQYTQGLGNRLLIAPLILGTTNSAVSVMEGNIPRVIENAEGMFPSLGKIFIA